MFVTALYADKWNGTFDEGVEHPYPDDRLIRAFLKELDGRRKTLVMLRNDDNANLVVGGGDGGRYIVYATFDNHSFQILSRDANSSLTVSLNAGGQVGEYPERWVVGIEDAMQAASCFAENGILDPSLLWEPRT